MRRLVYGFVSLAIIGSLCLLGQLPLILSSSWGVSLVTAWLTQRFPGSWQIARLELSWQGPQKVEGIRYSSEQGVALQIEAIDTPNSLLSLREKNRLPAFQVNGLSLISPQGMVEHVGLVLTPEKEGATVALSGFAQYRSWATPFALQGVWHGANSLEFCSKDNSVLCSLRLESAAALWEFELSFASLDLAPLHAFIEDEDVERFLGGVVDGRAQLRRNPSGSIQGSLELQSPKESSAFLKRLSFTCTLPAHSDNLSFALDIKQAIGAIQAQGTLHNLYHYDHSFHVNASLKHFPITLWSRFSKLPKRYSDTVEALLGTHVDAQWITTFEQGEGHVELQAQGVSSRLDASFGVNPSFVFLTKPLFVEVKWTPQLEQMVLRHLVPFLDHVLDAESPISLKIDAAKLGRTPPLLNELTVSSGALHLGRLKMHSAGSIQKILTLIGVPEKTVLAWFTPVYFRIDHGVAQVDRFDFLINEKYPFACWGEINIESQKLLMTLGISQTSLEKALSIRQAPPMLQVPIRGTAQRPELDTVKTAARLSALIAQEKGGATGSLVSGLVNAALDAREQPVPKATTNPLPWARERN